MNFPALKPPINVALYLLRPLRTEAQARADIARNRAVAAGKQSGKVVVLAAERAARKPGKAKP